MLARKNVNKNTYKNQVMSNDVEKTMVQLDLKRCYPPAIRGNEESPINGDMVDFPVSHV
jgi:hypothetical protein